MKEDPEAVRVLLKALDERDERIADLEADLREAVDYIPYRTDDRDPLLKYPSRQKQQRFVERVRRKLMGVGGTDES